jgi:hypothetical protein
LRGNFAKTSKIKYITFVNGIFWKDRGETLLNLSFSEICCRKKNNLLFSNIILFAYKHKIAYGLHILTLPILPTQNQGWGFMKIFSLEMVSVD